MNKRGAGSGMGILVLLAVAILGISAFGVYKLTADEPAAGSIAPAALTETGTVPVEAIVSCPSDGTTDGQVRYQDTIASTVTYGNPTVYFTPKSPGLERVTSGTLQTDGTYSTAIDLKCTESGTKWQAIAVTSQDAYSSAVGDDFVAEGSYSKVDLKGKAIDSLQVKVEDKFTGGANFFNISNIGDAAAAEGTWFAFNGTTATISNGAATGTSLTLGTDGYIDSRIFLKTAATKKQFGEDGLRVFFLVNADGSSWDEPIVARDGGAKLSDVKASLSSDDLRYYSGYEYAYEVGSFNDRESYIDFYIQSASGVNPSATSDPTVTLCAEGRYNSQKEQDSIKVGCWNDAATQTEVATADTPIMTFNVA